MGKSRYGFTDSDTSPLLAGYVVIFDGVGLQSASMTGTGTGLSVVLSTLPHINSINLDDGKLFFPAAQSASGDPNCLDDYEEGTWVAAMVCTTGTITLNNSYKTGYYTKIGNVVHAWGYFKVLSIDSAAGVLRITLPITPNALYSGCGSLLGFFDNDPQLYHPIIYAAGAVAQGLIVDSYSGSFVDTMAANIVADSYLYMEITYFV